jgi:hypothetical protein
MVDMADSKSAALGRAGSTPVRGTKNFGLNQEHHLCHT